MEYTDIRYSDIPTWYWFCECQSWRTGGRMVSKWIVWGRAVSCLHNQAPNWNTIDFLRWNTLTSGTVTLLRVLILWVPEQHNWRTDGLQMNCVGRAVSCLHNQAPISTQLTLVMESLTSVQWHYYVYWFCECQSSTTGGRMVSKWIVWGEQSHAYIIKHPIETHWLLVMEYTDSVQWHSYMYWFCECQSSTTGDGWSQMIVWGEQSQAYIIKTQFIWNIGSVVWWTHMNQYSEFYVYLIQWFHPTRTNCVSNIVECLQSHDCISTHIWNHCPRSQMDYTESIHVEFLHVWFCSSIPQGANCFSMGAWLCKHETALLTQFIGDHPSPVVLLWHSTDQYM